MGPETVASTTTFHAGALVAALFNHFAFCVAFALLVAWVVHRWDLVFGIVGGALMGLLLNLINFNTLSCLFPQFFPMRGGGMFWGQLF
jgi:hypothetical protein